MSEKDTPTPLTDAKEAGCDSLCDEAWGATGWELARQLERELTRALKLAEDNGKLAHQTACELVEAREGWKLSNEQTERAWSELAEAREQRDTLAESAKKALKEMCNTTAPRSSFTDSVDELDAALAAVKGGTP
jgi:hypothetical protein